MNTTAPLTRPLLLHGIRRQEKALGVPLDYLRDVVCWNPSVVMKLGLLAPLGNHRRHAPADALHLARIQATLAEDCGDCVQIAVNLARHDGIRPEWIQAVLQHQPEALPPELNLVYRFVEAVLGDTPEQEDYRRQVRQEYGNGALVEFSLAVALASFFPRFKRGLGHGASCSLHPVTV